MLYICPWYWNLWNWVRDINHNFHWIIGGVIHTAGGRLVSSTKVTPWFYAWHALEFLESMKAFFSTLRVCILPTAWLFFTFWWQWRLCCAWLEFKSHASGIRSHSAVDPTGQGLPQGSFHGRNLSRMRIGWKHITEVAEALGRRWWSLDCSTSAASCVKSISIRSTGFFGCDGVH